jgi:hypothetical protein
MHATAILIWATALVLVALVFWFDRRRVPPTRAAWATWPTDPRDLVAIARYAQRGDARASGRTMDDRTWTDLNLDDVFRLLDRAESLVGQQVLYQRLRAVPTADHLDAFEQLVRRFEADAAARDTAQRALRRLRQVDAATLDWLVQPGAFESAPWHVVFPILALSMLAATALAAVSIAGILLLALGTIVALVLRVTAASSLHVAGSAFRHVEPVVTVAERLQAFVTPDTAPLIGACATVGELASLRRVAQWAGRDTSGAAAGELSGIVTEYLNLLFALDGNAVYFGSRQIRAHGAQLMRVVQSVGEIDAALSVACYRAETRGWTRPIGTAAGNAVVFDGVRHPLVPDAVPATLHLAPPDGVIITGANMSGKTTFLRAIGVNAVLAQTIRTCTAARYEAPAFWVRSCIGRADDPASGKSYYLVEVEAVLGLVEASRSPEPHLFLFDELFRGTNTVERIATGEAVLATLLAPDHRAGAHLVVAATHDQELVDLLQPRYVPFHFADRVDEHGLAFDYQLRPGPATSRNAIALLRLRGAPAPLVARATARADALTVVRSATAGGA